MAAERARPHSQRVGGSDLRLGSSTAVPVDAGTLLLTCEAASKTVCGGRSISSLNGDLGRMVVFFDRVLRLRHGSEDQLEIASIWGIASLATISLHTPRSLAK